jgi:cyclic beta-1,2-glucan synthetase
MNRVGEHGKGESVWLAWFAIDVLRGFADVIAARDKTAAKKMRARATRYAKAVEENGWDGAWYRRGYYDDGTPLGSSESEEGKIDVLPQAWAAISGAGDAERTTQALSSADEILVKPDDKMILLFTPPFDKTDKNPGYIKGYLPGVRENGGQYTHGALWLTLAHAQRGEGDRAVELLQLLNPVEHARNETQSEVYKVEPYVVAADVYSLKGQEGRGGWTWYTGSAGWMYRVWVEAVLGFQPRADKLFIRPAIPKDWKEYALTYRHKASVYEIKVENPNSENGGVGEIKMDGKILSKKFNGEFFIPLKDDGKTHSITVRLGEAGSTPATPPVSKAIVKVPDESIIETDSVAPETNS